MVVVSHAAIHWYHLITAFVRLCILPHEPCSFLSSGQSRWTSKQASHIGWLGQPYLRAIELELDASETAAQKCPHVHDCTTVRALSFYPVFSCLSTLNAIRSVRPLSFHPNLSGQSSTSAQQQRQINVETIHAKGNRTVINSSSVLRRQDTSRPPPHYPAPPQYATSFGPRGNYTFHLLGIHCSFLVLDQHHGRPHNIFLKVWDAQ